MRSAGCILNDIVDKDYDWDRISNFLISGNFPKISNVLSNLVLVSEVLANRLQLEVGDTFLII